MKFKVLTLILVVSLALLAGCSSQETANTTSADVVASASMVTDEASLLKAISEDGEWIVLFEEDFTTDKELVIEGVFYNKDDVDRDLYRKIAPYTQDDDHNVIDRFTITAPKLTVNSPNTKIQGGTFAGDVYVQANGFTIQDAKVEGNIYFANEEYKSSFDMSNKGVVTGVTEVNSDVDLVTAASITDDAAAFEKALGEDGTWIICSTDDLIFNSELVIEGVFYNKDDTSSNIYRKVGPYLQDDNHNITERFTITAPQFTVKSPNTRFQGGIFAGDVYVEADGFNLSDAKVEGNIYFASEEYKSSFDMSDSEVTGVIEVK